MLTNIKPEDIVYLNTGSPPLVVMEISGSNVFVTWTGSYKSIEYSMFPMACLITRGPDRII